MNAPDPTDAVIACSLTPEEGADRTSEFRALFAGAHVAAHREPRVLSVWFDNRPGLHEALSDLLRRERDCCPFFDYEALDESPRARLLLRVPNHAAEQWLDWVQGSIS